MWLHELLEQHAIARRWSARLRESRGYKHLAPAGRRTPKRLLLHFKLKSSPKLPPTATRTE